MTDCYHLFKTGFSISIHLTAPSYLSVYCGEPRFIPMKEQIKERIEQLKAEYESGQKMLADLEIQESNLRSTMLRISGAIQVLEELLAKAEEEENIDDAKKVEVLSQ